MDNYKLLQLRKSHRKDKKYDAILLVNDEVTKIVSFGAKKLIDGKYIPYSDFTIHKDVDRKERYLDRHREREDWTKTGVLTPGFWSRWVLWNKPTLTESIKDVTKRFNL